MPLQGVLSKIFSLNSKRKPEAVSMNLQSSGSFDYVGLGISCQSPFAQDDRFWVNGCVLIDSLKECIYSPKQTTSIQQQRTAKPPTIPKMLLARQKRSRIVRDLK